jgi:lysophospholipase L1-like esterase
VLSGYGKHLRRVLEGRAYVYTWGGFVTDPDASKLSVRKFREAASIKPFDYIVFNNGLHSLHWTEDKVTDAQVKAVQRGICQAFKAAAPQAKVFWLATTPHTSRERNAARKVEAFGELNGMVQRINRLSAEVMREEGVPVIDAYSLLAARLDLAAGDAYHWTGEGYTLLSEFIAKGLGFNH